MDLNVDYIYNVNFLWLYEFFNGKGMEEGFLENQYEMLWIW